MPQLDGSQVQRFRVPARIPLLNLGPPHNNNTNPRQQRRPHVNTRLRKRSIASHLGFIQPRAVMQRGGQARVLAAEDLLFNPLALLVKRLGLGILALQCSTRRTSILDLSTRDLQPRRHARTAQLCSPSTLCVQGQEYCAPARRLRGKTA